MIPAAQSDIDHNPILQTAVRDLVQFTHTGGDLAQVYFTDSTAMLEGQRLHRFVQKKRPDDFYRSEVSVQQRLSAEWFDLIIGGRIDGVWNDSDTCVIEEIKSIRSHPQEGLSAHWAQAKIYAYLFALEHELPALAVQLTYISSTREPPSEFRKHFNFQELEEYFLTQVQIYLEWLDQIESWHRHRNDSIERLEFPFGSYRPGQREMAVQAYSAIRLRHRIQIQAPTGMGKTIAAIFPAVKAFGEGHCSRIFFLTARSTGKEIAESGLARLRSEGLNLRSITLTAKEKICFKPGSVCHPDECRYADRYYDKLKNALTDSMQHHNLNRDRIEELARKHSVCPFEFSLDCALLADLIIADYNYVFDLRVYLRRFFQTAVIFGRRQSYTLLIDEAHNLVNRARSMYSESLQKADFLLLRRKVKSAAAEIYKELSKANRIFLEYRKLGNNEKTSWSDPCKPEKLIRSLQKLVQITEKWLIRHPVSEIRSDLIDAYFQWVGFLRISEEFGGNYCTCYEMAGRNLEITLYCLNPAPQLEEALSRTASAVFFSATLSPGSYYRDILGCPADTQWLSFPSPFPAENRKVVLFSSISTRWKDRSATVPQVCQVLEAACRSRLGNYLFFFPSYHYMKQVWRLFVQLNIDADLHIQNAEWNEIERGQFISRFLSHTKPQIGFAVMGGVFGEGIDLAGQALSGVVIVGVGLPAVSLQQELIRKHFDSIRRGFEYAYQYPGMTRVLQAAGRVIRSDRDRGIIIIVDDRIKRSGYRKLLPADWQQEVVNHLFQLRRQLRNFWKIQGEETL